MSSRTPAITIVEPSIHDGDDLSRIPTNGSGSLSAIDEDREHKQDWTVTTDEKDSWANKERRRSSVWGKLELVPSATSPKKKNFMTAGGQPRRGSILSMWEGGKDKDGRDILAHDDHSDEEEESVGSPMSNEEEQGKASLERERRGSILSIWRKGKDEHGNHAIVHDDEEYSQADRLPSRTSSDSTNRPKQRELPTSSFFV
ncbi:hypothetical protein F5882DRAFT_385815 [Hyaloscypha sp. PMI_1271]|nr:hypothetical protein F5882DRAFT_385815 [Hyaloscypha sp. PMI_1271]